MGAEEETFLGESSTNSQGSRSQNSTINNNNTNTSNHSKASSSSQKLNNVNNINDASNDGLSWECSLCTYRNSADTFKCDVCEKRRGTSTRKPRTTSDNIIAQVLRQQEQIRQQAIKSTRPRCSNSPANTKTRSKNTSRAENHTRSGSRSRSPFIDGIDNPSDDSYQTDDSSREKVELSKSKSKNGKKINNNINSETVVDNNNANPTDKAVANNKNKKSAQKSEFPEQNVEFDNASSDSEVSNSSNTSIATSVSQAPSSSAAQKPPQQASELNSSNPVKISPLEEGSNKFRYSPPTASGKAGLIIDKRRFTQHSITVNNVTITVTEYATRKKKETAKKKKKKVAAASN